MKMPSKIQTVVVAVAVVAALVTLAIYVNEARNEVIYVCANFGPGVTEQSVNRQLDTLSLSDVYRDGATTRYSSWLTARSYECVIHIEQSLVTRAYVNSTF